MNIRNKKLTIGIIGYGRFGQLWAKHLADIGQVLLYDKKKIQFPIPHNAKAVSLEQAAAADLLFFAAPISQLESSVREARKYINPKTIVADVCSVKLITSQILKKNLHKNQSIVGTHPLFGPDSAGNAKNLKGFKIVVTPVQIQSRQFKLFTGILKSLGLQILITTPQNHDRQMANSQGLIHFIGRGLEGLTLAQQQIATKDYGSLLHIKDMVVHDTWQLFLDMHRHNKFTLPVRKKFLSRLLQVENLIRDTPTTLKDARREIDQIDERLIEIIAHRNMIGKIIGRLKKKDSQNITDRARERELRKLHQKLSKEFGVNAGEVRKIFSIIISHSKRLQSHEY